MINMSDEVILTDDNFQKICLHDCRSYSSGKPPFRLTDDKLTCIGCGEVFDKPGWYIHIKDMPNKVINDSISTTSTNYTPNNTIDRWEND